MKKFIVFISVLALISFAACAFAASGGHVNPDANVDTTPVVDYEPAAEDVTGSGATVTLVDFNVDTPDGFDAADIYLPTETANKVAVMTNVKVSVTGYTAGSPVKFSFANYTDSETDDLYAFVVANQTQGDYKKGIYYSFECTTADKVLSFTVGDPEVFFTEKEIIIAKVETVPSGGGGGGGCNAGYAGLLLLAAVPLFFRKK